MWTVNCLDGPVPAGELGAHPHELGDLDGPCRRTLHLHATVDDVEVVDRRLELLGRDLEQLTAGLACCLENSAAKAVCHLAPGRHRGVWRAGGVGDVDANLVRGHAERLRRDQGEAGGGAADVWRTDHDRDGSVGLDAAAGG